MMTSKIRELNERLCALDFLESSSKRQLFNFLIVLDFEATCWQYVKKSKNEIIEFAAVLFDVENGKIVDEFQRYVKPTENPELSAFCTDLTGINQATVDESKEIVHVLRAFDDWLIDKKREFKFNFRCHNSIAHIQCTMSTWSDWDLGTCLKKECKRKYIDKPVYFNEWMDVRKMFIEFYKVQPLGLVGALHTLKMEFQGKEHCGLDDAKNTAYLIRQMVNDGCQLRVTKSL